MALGTTLTISTDRGKALANSVVATDESETALGSVIVTFDDDEPVFNIIKALEAAKAWLVNRPAVDATFGERSMDFQDERNSMYIGALV